MSDSAATTDVADVIAEALAAVSAAIDEEALDELRVAYLGRRGRLTGILRGLGALPPERRRDVQSGNGPRVSYPWNDQPVPLLILQWRRRIGPPKGSSCLSHTGLGHARMDSSVY